MSARHAILSLAKYLGGFALARSLTGSGLRILCYHGISLADEHEFAPKLFMREDTFRRRMGYLQRECYPVLGLGEALVLLGAGRLPPRAVVITFDDGWLGTGTKAAPILRDLSFPSTLYVATREVVEEVPVFIVALRYLLWKGRRHALNLSPLRLGSGVIALDMAASRERAVSLIGEAASSKDAEGQTALLKDIARMVQVDWQEIEQASLFRRVDLQQLTELPALGMELQLHTHNHLLPGDDAATVSYEIVANRAALRAAARGPLVHFCYPSGQYHPRQFVWLHQLGIESATTCLSGFNYPASERMELRRFLDGEHISQVEFEAELSGFLEMMRKARGVLTRFFHKPRAYATGNE